MFTYTLDCKEQDTVIFNMSDKKNCIVMLKSLDIRGC